MADAANPPSRDDIMQYAAESGERTWRKMDKPDADFSVRELFRYSLALCEAGVDIDRVPVLLRRAAKLQDHRPDSATYGNFNWYWHEYEAKSPIRDRNAVDFCMMSGSLIWLRHRDQFDEGFRRDLRTMLELGAKGCIRHQVPPSYTNISIMNALDLILLGEGLGKPEIAEEGYSRFNRFYLHTWEWGIHEYCSPTYYGINLQCLGLIRAFCEKPQGRQMARALLELLWTDIALNWYDPAQRIPGPCSRDYRYLHGTGCLDTMMWLAGWLSGDKQGGVHAALAQLGFWQPPDRLRKINLERYPRLVRQSWGIGTCQTRTCYIDNDVTLGISAASYGYMDLPLTVDLAGGRNQPRCYFIPDGRGDPYGKKHVPAGAHSKAHHLRPFWTGVQRGVDALGLVMYHQRVVRECTESIQSHFVMRRKVDEFRIGDRKVDLSGDEPVSFDVAAGECVFFRNGSACVGIRVPWSRKIGGGSASMSLVNDGNEYGAVRLTISHGDPGEFTSEAALPGAALWIRTGSGLDDEGFDNFRDEFVVARVVVDVTDASIRLQAAGRRGPLTVASSKPYTGVAALLPLPTRAVLELDGNKIGREILETVDLVGGKDKPGEEEAPCVVLRHDHPVEVEAESGLVLPAMTIAEAPGASGRRYVWQPGEPGGKGGNDGAIIWRILVQDAGSYYIWGRVTAPTSSDDSFRIRVISNKAEPVSMASWHTGTHKNWEWTPLRLERSDSITPLRLPEGELRIELRSREDGTKLDKLYLSSSPENRPE